MLCLASWAIQKFEPRFKFGKVHIKKKFRILAPGGEKNGHGPIEGSRSSLAHPQSHFPTIQSAEIYATSLIYVTCLIICHTKKLLRMIKISRKIFTIWSFVILRIECKYYLNEIIKKWNNSDNLFFLGFCYLNYIKINKNPNKFGIILFFYWPVSYLFWYLVNITQKAIKQ